MRKILKNILSLVFSLVLLCSNFLHVTAKEVTPVEPMIFVEKYEITNERIIPGENFTLSITLKNYSTLHDAKDVQIDIQNPNGVAPIYGTVSQLYVGDIKAGEEKSISFEYDSWTTIKSDTLDFVVSIYSSAMSNSIILRVPSSADIPFSLLASNIPSDSIVGEYNSASLTFKVLGEENVSDVVLMVVCNGEMIGSSQAGSITAGTTKTQSTTFILNEIGKYTLDIYLEYVSSDGEKNTVLMDNKSISVGEKTSFSLSEIQQQIEQQDSTNNNVTILGISGVLLLTIFVLVIVIFRKKR